MEADNPAGYSLALELGYAHALGKHIVLVEEHPNEERYRYFSMVREVANETFATLEQAVDHISSLGPSVRA
jgi:nucleoside 2-deoxyribosyltransferase